MDTNTYRRLKVTNNKLRKSNKILGRLLVLNVIIAVGSVLCLLTLGGLYVTQLAENNKLESDLADCKAVVKTQSNELLMAAMEIDELSVVAGELEQENSDLVATLETQQTELDKLKERQELYDKYEYALVREDGTRTDIEFEHIEALEELADKEGLGEDAVALVLAISRNESQGYSNVKNPKSSAAGLCGLLKSTAKFSYETLMENGAGSYKTEYAYDSLTNLEMALEYVAYLKDNTKSNQALLVAYRGDSKDKTWYKKISKYIGKSIEDLDI